MQDGSRDACTNHRQVREALDRQATRQTCRRGVEHLSAIADCPPVREVSGAPGGEVDPEARIHDGRAKSRTNARTASSPRAAAWRTPVLATTDVESYVRRGRNAQYGLLESG